MRSISIKAVLAGTVLGLLLDLLTGVVLMFLFSPGAQPAGAADANVEKVFAIISHDPSFLFLSLVLGALTTVVAGYVSALVAKRLPYMNAVAVGVVGLVLGVFLADSSLPLWFNALGFASVLPCALVGGHMAKRRQQAGA